MSIAERLELWVYKVVNPRVHGSKLDESNNPVEESLARAAPEFVFVEVELD